MVKITNNKPVRGSRLTPCMPPLLDEEKIAFCSTNYSGSVCENLVRAYFISQQINVAEPSVDDGVDFLIEKGKNNWVRGQVKKVLYHPTKNVIKTTNQVIYRENFYFNFQGGGKSPKRNIRQRTKDEIDFFYHVLITPYRQLIWETPTSLIPLRENGEFINTKEVVLDRNSIIRKKADIDFNQLLLYTFYDPIIFKSFPEFFLDKSTTLDEFFEYDQ